jgi:predicted outer membrane repeat protein
MARPVLWVSTIHFFTHCIAEAFRSQLVLCVTCRIGYFASIACHNYWDRSSSNAPTLPVPALPVTTFPSRPLFPAAWAGLTYGGGMFMTNCNDAVLKDTTFMDNHSQQFGGALSCRG